MRGAQVFAVTNDPSEVGGQSSGVVFVRFRVWCEIPTLAVVVVAEDADQPPGAQNGVSSLYEAGVFQTSPDALSAAGIDGAHGSSTGAAEPRWEPP